MLGCSRRSEIRDSLSTTLGSTVRFAFFSRSACPCFWPQKHNPPFKRTASALLNSTFGDNHDPLARSRDFEPTAAAPAHGTRESVLPDDRTRRAHSGLCV